MTDPFFDDNYNLWVMLQRARDATRTVRAEELSAIGISVIEAGVIVSIKGIERILNQKATITEIARWLFRKHHTMSALIKRMESRGIVARIEDPTGRGLKKVILTEKGNHLYELATQSQIIQEIISSLTEEEKHQLWVILGKIRNKAMDQLGMRDSMPFPRFI